jgi:hypothetical protein
MLLEKEVQNALIGGVNHPKRSRTMKIGGFIEAKMEM